MKFRSARNEESIAALHNWVFELEGRIKRLEERAILVSEPVLRPYAETREEELRANAAMHNRRLTK